MAGSGKTEGRVPASGRMLLTVFLAVIMFFFLSVGVRTFTRQVLVKHFGVDNAFTRTVLFDQAGMAVVEDGDIQIDWEGLYPFDSADGDVSRPEGAEPVPAEAHMAPALRKAVDRVESAEGRIETYATDHLPFYDGIVRGARTAEALVRWNYASIAAYNSVVIRDDGSLLTLVERQDMDASAESVSQLADWCERRGAAFAYIQAPSKTCEEQDADIANVLDYGNANADELLGLLESSGVSAFDFRKAIHEEGLDHHGLFYRTDHHWLGHKGPWYAARIGEFLSGELGIDVDVSKMGEGEFEYRTLSESFLGSQGKKMTEARCGKDDFTFALPKYETSVHFECPSKGVDETGSMAVMIREMEGYDGENLYGLYNWGDQPFSESHNLLAPNHSRLLVILDSFGNCVMPYLSLCVEDTYSVDPRYFTGSIRSLIGEIQPDAVLLLMNPGVLKAPDYSTHESMMDFR